MKSVSTCSVRHYDAVVPVLVRILWDRGRCGLHHPGVLLERVHHQLHGCRPGDERRTILRTQIALPLRPVFLNAEYRMDLSWSARLLCEYTSRGKLWAHVNEWP